MEARMTMATTTAFGNLVLSFMSAWMVGNVEAPAKANMIELNARKGLSINKTFFSLDTHLFRSPVRPGVLVS